MDGAEGDMTAIGVDTHKATLAACAVDPLGTPIAEATFQNDLKGHLAFIAWARSNAPEATIGIEADVCLAGARAAPIPFGCCLLPRSGCGS